MMATEETKNTQEKIYNVDAAFEVLYREGITTSVQGVRRFLREGELIGERSEYLKEGWRIRESDLNRFIEERRQKDPRVAIIADLKRKIAKLEEENRKLKEQLEHER